MSVVRYYFANNIRFENYILRLADPIASLHIHLTEVFLIFNSGAD